MDSTPNKYSTSEFPESLAELHYVSTAVEFILYERSFDTLIILHAAAPK